MFKNLFKETIEKDLFILTIYRKNLEHISFDKIFVRNDERTCFAAFADFCGWFYEENTPVYIMNLENGCEIFLRSEILHISIEKKIIKVVE